MKKKNFFATLVVMLAALTFVACGGSDDDKDPPVNPKESNLAGSITSTLNLDATKTYTLSGSLVVEAGGVLNIPAGTTIKAKKGFSSYILVLRGGKINVNGTAAKPVVMTADKENAGAGYWGGLIINGKANISGDWSGSKTPQGSTEINSAYAYGGTNNADNSGSIKYLKLMYTGARSSADVEHNGFTLNAVGSGTTIENIYVYECSDDGIEFFGGSVNVKNLLTVNTDDDMFDVTQGWTGTLENCYGIWEKGYTSTESDPRGVEADGNLDGKNPSHTKQSDFKIKNMTIDLRLAANETEGYYMHDVIKVRRGAKANIENALVKGTGQVKDLIDLNDKRGAGNPASIIKLTNKLTTAPKGKTINGTAAGATIVSGNNGCKTSVFGWTGYSF